MKVTIWQQFNSNHSSSYTVVGQFDTTETAQRAYRAFYQLFTGILQERASTPHDIMTPAERSFSQDHNIRWEAEGIDWLRRTTLFENHLNQSEQIVFISTGWGETWQLPEPIIEALKALGVQHIYIIDYDQADFTVRLTCIAPDQRRAVSITQAVNTVLATVDAPITVDLEDLEDREERTIDWAQPQANGFIQFEDYNLSGGEPATYTPDNRVSIAVCFTTLHLGLPAMVQWLKMLGCTDIAYTFSEEPLDGTEFDDF